MKPKNNKVGVHPMPLDLLIVILSDPRWGAKMKDQPTLLLVEDDSNDAAFFRMVFKKVYPQINIQHVADATLAMHYLHDTGVFKERELFPLPYAIVVDLTLPGISGASLVKWIRQQAAFGKTLIVAWTGSNNTTDIAQLYNCGANSFLKKTTIPEQLSHDVRELHEFWQQMEMLINFVPQHDYSIKPASNLKPGFFYRQHDWPDFEPPPSQ